MNILYLCDEYPPGRHGGIGTAVQLLAREMVKKGHLVIVAGFYDWGYGEADFFEDEGVKVYRFRRMLASRLFIKQDSLLVRFLYKVLKISGIFEWDIKRSLKKYKLFLEKLIAEYGIDIVEMPDYNDYMRFCKSVVLFPKLSIPTTIKAHGSITFFSMEENLPVLEIIWQMENKLFLQVDAVSAVSADTASKTAAYLKYPFSITTLYNGLSIPHFSHQVKMPGRVIFTGSLSNKKGINQLLLAWNIVNQELPKAQLYIYGKGPVEKLKMLLSDKAINAVFFKGHVSRKELYQELGKATVGVFPSFAECFALAPMEAMLCNTATIYTSRASGPELIEDGINGILVDPDDVNAIASKIIYLLTNEDVCKKIADNGRKQILDKFDINVVADKNIDFYKSVLHKM